MDWFRAEIKKAYGGRAPRVLDPFAGGGAIPLEAMRLGCEVTAIDINPVAWLILKCTLEYPQKLAGQTRPLPKFALESGEFMEAYLKGTGKLSKKQSTRSSPSTSAGSSRPPRPTSPGTFARGAGGCSSRHAKTWSGSTPPSTASPP